MYHTTMIHGRFQPFHIGHFDYFKKALEITDNTIIIGITNPTPDLTKQETSDDHRHLLSANPFTYFQRYNMIRESILNDSDICQSYQKVVIVPFPIHDMHKWEYFIPSNVVQVMSAFEEWDFEKKKRFEKYGFQVHSLSCERLTSGTIVRNLLSSSDNSTTLDNLLPQGTRKTISLINDMSSFSTNKVL